MDIFCMKEHQSEPRAKWMNNKKIKDADIFLIMQNSGRRNEIHIHESWRTGEVQKRRQTLVRL